MKERGRPKKKPEAAQRTLQNKLMSLKPGAILAFDVLKAEQGARSGPRLAAEAIDLLLAKYGKPPIGFP